MTNAEKFIEVFGFKPNTEVCYLPEDVGCPLYDTCDNCPYNKWLDEEYTGISPTDGEWIDAEVLDKIRAEIADLDDADYDYEGYYKAVTDAVKIIDKYKEGSE